MFSFVGDGLGDHVSEIWSTYFETEVGLQENPKNCLAADLHWRVISDLTKRFIQNFSIVLFSTASGALGVAPFSDIYIYI